MNFENIHSSIDMELMQVDAEIASQLRKVCGGDALHDRALHSFFRVGGKKLRPRLLLLSAFALKRDNLRGHDNGPLHDLLISLAAMVEMVHSASLMHDDVLDDSEIRRGQESVNSKFGNKKAILGGDILYSQAFEMLIRATKDEISVMLVKCVCRMCRAEVRSLSQYDYETYLGIVEDKTASLMAFCCKAGVETARRDEHSQVVADALVEFGYNYGMVYQLADDLDDGDNQIVNAERGRTVRLLNQYVDSAKSALSIVPDSIYKEGLTRLLQYVLRKSRTFTKKKTNQVETSNNYAVIGTGG